MRTVGEFSFTRDARSANFNLVISNYAALYAFAHGHIHVIFTVCCRQNECYLGFIWKTNMIPNAHKLPRIPSALLVAVFTSFLIYLFVKNTLSSKV